MRYTKITGPIIGTPAQKLNEVNFRLIFILIMFLFCLGTGIGIKLLYPNDIMGDLMGAFFGLASLLPLSLAPSYIKMRRKLKDSIIP